MTQLAANFAAKGLLILMTSNSLATCLAHNLVLSNSHQESDAQTLLFWRGLWTWPPWVICALAFNHKLKKFCTYRGCSEISQQDGRTKNWPMKRLLQGKLRLKNCPTSEQIHNGRLTDEIPRDPITPWCGPQLFCPCSSVAETSVLKIL